MHGSRRIAAVAAVVAIAAAGCGQLAGGQAGSAEAASIPAPTTSPPPSAAIETTVAPSHAAAPRPPVEFTGRIVCGPPVSSDRRGVEQIVDLADAEMVLTRYRSGAWSQSVTMSDPRLEGSIHHTYESDSYTIPGSEEGPRVAAATWRIVNAEGIWEHRGFEATYLDGAEMGDPVMPLIGSEGYAGLVALMEVTATLSCGVEVKGVIFDGAPVPEPYVAP